MSLRDLQEALKNDNVSFGVKEVLKAAKTKKLKKTSKVFVSRDCRDETIEKLESANVEFEVLKNKEEIAKYLGIDFESEVYLIL
jgi:ribosomal protein L7Ae-like RNA K-turn-binding protein